MRPQSEYTTTQYVVASEVAESAAGKFRIFHWKEYAEDESYDPHTDDNLPLWEACHRVIAALERHNSRAAAQLLVKMPEKAEDIHQLAYYLYTYCERKGDAANARVYNTLVTCSDAITQAMVDLGVEGGKPRIEQGELF